MHLFDPALLGSGSPDEVEAAVRRCRASRAGDRAFILMPGCDIPAETPLANVTAFFRAGRGE